MTSARLEKLGLARVAVFLISSLLTFTIALTKGWDYFVKPDVANWWSARAVFVEGTTTIAVTKGFDSFVKPEVAKGSARAVLVEGTTTIAVTKGFDSFVKPEVAKGSVRAALVEGNACADLGKRLSALTSRTAMQQNGWWFSPGMTEISFMSNGFFQGESSGRNVGSMTAALKGSGTITLRLREGRTENDTESRLEIYKVGKDRNGGQLQAVVSRGEEKEVAFTYQDGDMLDITNYHGIVQLESVATACGNKVVPPPARGKLPLNLSRVTFFSHRSCSQDPNLKCSKDFAAQLRTFSTIAKTLGLREDRTYMLSSLPESFMQNATWRRHVTPMLRGRGFWFWKSALANYFLANMSDGDILIYLDGDQQPTLNQTLDLLRDPHHEQIDMFCRAEMGHQEYVWTKGDIFKRFGVDPQRDVHYAKTGQYEGGGYAIRVNNKTRRFMRIWEDLASDFHLISDEESVSANAAGFRENRHDQSLFSMLLKANKASHLRIPPGMKDVDELYIVPFGSEVRVPWAPHPDFFIPGFRWLDAIHR